MKDAILQVINIKSLNMSILDWGSVFSFTPKENMVSSITNGVLQV
jgi:hypothetical protein